MYTQNYGRPGFIYVLENEGLRAGFYKIGCSTRSGDVRARDLNIDAGTGTPGLYRCVFQHAARDCGRTERVVFTALEQYRRGKWGQEFFEVDLELAKATIARICLEIDATVPLEQRPRAELDARVPAPRRRRGRGLDFFLPVAFMVFIAGYLLLRYKPTPAVPKPAVATQSTTPPRISDAPTTTPTEPWPPPISSNAPKQVDLAKLRPVVQSEMGKATADEQSSMHSACDSDRIMKGDMGLYRCLAGQLYELRSAKRPDFSGLSETERAFVEDVCRPQWVAAGPAIYHRCRVREIGVIAARK